MLFKKGEGVATTWYISCLALSFLGIFGSMATTLAPGSGSEGRTKIGLIWKFWHERTYAIKALDVGKTNRLTLFSFIKKN